MFNATLLQVGDVHYPDWSDAPYEVDHKDKKISSELLSGVTHRPLRLVLDRLSNLSDRPNTLGVCFMGDLTTRGSQTHLEAAIQHMSWLCKSKRCKDALPTLMLVPGNHDVEKSAARDFGQIGKFGQMSDLAEKTLFAPLPIELHVPVPLSCEQGKISVFLMNTTLGSWEPYFLPRALQNALDSATSIDGTQIDGPQPGLADISPAGETVTGMLEYYDQLDTPYVSANALVELRKSIEQTPRSQPIVIIGHHNILPQEQPRLSAYAEMINAGFFRRFLLSLGRPIIYLHGHTHRDTVEVISDPRNSKARIICIAAPKLEDGFNEITFHFDKKKQSLGIRLLPWRLSADRSAFSPSVADQAAWSLIDGAVRISGPSDKLLSVMTETKEARFNFLDIQELSPDHDQAQIVEALLELFFWRLIDIDRVGAATDEWLITIARNSR